MHGAIANFVATYGYPLLFLLVAVESFGVPLPGETALVTAAAYAAMGRLNIIFVIAVAALGAIVGDNGGYWLGRKGGIALVRRYGRHVGLTEARREQAHRFFERHGGKTVFLARFIALLRSWAAALAGVGCMRYRTFMLYNAAGGVVWAVLYGILAYAFGRNVPRLQHYLGSVNMVLVAVVVCAAVGFFCIRWYRRKRQRQRAR